MRKLFELLVIAAIWIGAGVAINRWCLRPWSCNRALNEATQISKVFYGATTGAPEVPILARGNIARLRSCYQDCPSNVPLAMVLAYNYRQISNPRKAIEIYQDSLRFDRRPELYLNLGLAQLEAGDEPAGVRTLIQASLYNPTFVDEIGLQHDEVKRAVDTYQLHLMHLMKLRSGH